MIRAALKDRTTARCHRPSVHPARLGIGLVAAVGLAATMVAPSVQAADPQLSQIRPAGVQRGTEAEVELRGARLSDAQELMIYDPGLTVTHLEVASAAVVKVKLAVDGECRLGPHGVRVRTASGISNLKTFSVGALPVVDEAEPNSEIDQPQKIELGTTVHGVVQNEDVDYFTVDAKKGQRISVEVEGLRLGDTFFDPYVAILDAERFVLSGSDDTPLVRQDAVAAAVVPENGSYIIQVRESAFGGSGNCRYLLHVGQFPRPLAVYPVGEKLGQSLEVRWLGDAAGEWTEQVTLPGEAPAAEFGLFAKDQFGIAPSASVFRLGDLDNVLEAEPNNTPDEATGFEGSAALNGIIAEPGDVDTFKFAAKKGQVYDIRVHARSVRSPLDPVLDIQRSGGAGAGSNDDSGGPDSYLRFRAPEDDDYLLSVRDHLKAGGPEYVYRVEITPVSPALTMGLPERRRYIDITGAVPQGNRYAVMVSAQRSDFGGDLAVEIQGVPEGVTVETFTMPGDQTTMPVLFTSAADAPLGGSLADVIGRHTAGDRQIEGRLRQRTSLVRGQNNREVWNHYTRRMAMAVTQKIPFSIEIVQPKVPIVQNGSMQLKVVAQRDEGFTVPITLRTLYNPPGVSTPTSVTMAEGSSEAIVPLTANSKARLGTWKIAIKGGATVGDGSVSVSTQLADLEVSAPYFKFSFPVVAVEQGQETRLVLGVEQAKEFEGPAKVELLGLPNEVTSQGLELTKETTELVFPLKTTEKSPAGHHKSVLCRAVVLASGEPITHTLGTGQLRIQKPLPQKPAEPAKKPEPKPQAKSEEPKQKPLSRLEQLRQQTKQSKEGA